MATAFVRPQLPDFFLSTMLAALDVVHFEELGQRPDEYPNFFKVESTTRSIVRASEVAGFGLFNQVNEASNIRYDQPRPAYNKTYVPVDWGLGYKVSHRMMADDEFGLVSGFARALSRACKESYEVDHALIYNRAFNSSYTGPDGKTLAATDHPLVGGGTQANRPAVDVDLDIASLEAALTQFRKFVDHRGKKVRLIPKTLVVPPELVYTALEILRSPNRSDTANNTINAFNELDEGGGLQVRVYNYLTDPDAWFLITEPSRLRVRSIWREKPDTAHDKDFDSRSLKTAMWMTYITGWDGYEGFWGTSGG